MSNLTHDAGKPRFLKLLFVVLMMSVGLNLLLGCGKSNKGQVVGPTPPKCEKDCEDKKPFSGELWETALGVVDYPGYGEPGMFIKLGLDLYVADGAGSQGIVPTPIVGGNVEAEGSLFVDQLQLYCGQEQVWMGWWWYSQPKYETIPNGEYQVVKNLAAGKATSDGFSGNKLELKKGSTVLTIEMGNQQFIPGQGIKDPAGNQYDFYLFGQIAITNSNGCVAYPWLSTGNINYNNNPLMRPYNL